MEYGILVIKPDGLDQSIVEVIEKELDNNELKVIASYSLKLTEKEAEKIFNTNAFDPDAYYSYLCSGALKILLVQGSFAISKLQKIKYKVRTFFHCDKCMKNLLHTSDTGNEYKFQFQMLFPNLRYEEYPLFADMHIPLEKHLISGKHTNPGGIVIDSNNLKELKHKFALPYSGLIGVKTDCRWYQHSIPIICYIRSTDDWCYKLHNLTTSPVSAEQYIQDAALINGVCIVDYLPFEMFSHELVSELKDMGIGGFKVFDLRYSLQQIERVRYFVQYRYKLLYTGGSNSFDGSLLTVDQEMYQRLLNKLKYGQ